MVPWDARYMAHIERSTKCPYCGGPRPGASPVVASCAVCGMAIPRSSRRHIVLVRPEDGTYRHLCSVRCMDLLREAEEATEDG